MATSTEHQPPSLLRKIVYHERMDERCIQELLANPVFEFRTVVHRNVQFPTSLACDCVLLHEYFGYISNDGLIEEYFQKVCTWIDANECPHVATATESDHEIVTTSITAQHAIAVMGKDFDLYNQFFCQKIGLCNITADISAVMKRRYSFIEYFVTERTGFELCTSKFCSFERYKSRLDEPLKLYFTDPIVFCIRHDDMDMLVLLLKCKLPYSVLFTAIKYATHLNKETMCEALLRSCITKGRFPGTPYPTFPGYEVCIELIPDVTLDAALLDHPNMLQLLENFEFFSNTQKEVIERVRKHVIYAYQLSEALGHNECAHILRKYIGDATLPQFDTNAFSIALSVPQIRADPQQRFRVLRKLRDCGFDINSGDSREVWKWILTHIDENPYAFKFGNTQRHDYPNISVCFNTIAQPPHSAKVPTQSDIGTGDIISELLELGCDVNLSNLCNWVGLSNIYKGGRKRAIKAFLYANNVKAQDIPLYKRTAASLDLQLARNVHSSHTTRLYFQMKFPAISVQDCVTPLLWECGIYNEDPVTDQSIPDQVRAYLVDVMSQPRSLKMSCRDTLRTHFQGLRIHDYVQMMQCPTRIRNYVLMTDLLQDPCDTV